VKVAVDFPPARRVKAPRRRDDGHPRLIAEQTSAGAERRLNVTVVSDRSLFISSGLRLGRRSPTGANGYEDA